MLPATQCMNLILIVFARGLPVGRRPKTNRIYKLTLPFAQLAHDLHATRRFVVSLFLVIVRRLPSLIVIHTAAFIDTQCLSISKRGIWIVYFTARVVCFVQCLTYAIKYSVDNVCESPSEAQHYSPKIFHANLNRQTSDIRLSITVLLTNAFSLQPFAIEECFAVHLRANAERVHTHPLCKCARVFYRLADLSQS